MFLHVSTISVIPGEEPLFTSLHSEFIGTCDYIWFAPAAAPLTLSISSANSADATEFPVAPPTKGARSTLKPIAVLVPPPIEYLPNGLPAAHWGSDHVCLVTEFHMCDS